MEVSLLDVPAKQVVFDEHVPHARLQAGLPLDGRPVAGQLPVLGHVERVLRQHPATKSHAPE